MSHFQGRPWHKQRKTNIIHLFLDISADFEGKQTRSRRQRPEFLPTTFYFKGHITYLYTFLI